MTMTLVSTTTIGSGGATNIEWTNIPQTGKDLLVLLSNRLDAGQFTGNLQFNSDTASNYNVRRLFTNGNGVFADSILATRIQFFGMGRNDATSNTFASDAIYVSNYTSSVAKSVSVDGVSESDTTDAFRYGLGISAGRWTGTTAITSLLISADSSNFVQHTVASLYIIS